MATRTGSSPRASWSGRPTVTSRCGCSAPTSTRTTARSPASGRGIWRRWGSFLCRRCVCAGRRGWSGWGRWPWTGRSCARTPRGTKAMSYERMLKAERRLEAEIAALRANVRALLEEAEAVDAEEDERYGPDRRGDELRAELQRREQRLARIREAKQALEAEAAEREAARRAELEAQGKTPRAPRGGRDPYAPRPGAQRNFTDPDSRIMKTS